MITNEMKAVYGLYIGCSCEFYIGFDNYAKGKLVGIKTDMAIIEPFPEQETAVPLLLHRNGKPDVLGCRLILTPLSEITDEDAIAICKMGNDRLSQPEDQLVVGRQIAANMVSVFIEEPFLYNYVEIIDFLRSKSYMLPYMGIDLFESRIAIPKQ